MKHVVRFVQLRHTRPKSGRAKTPKRLAAIVTGAMSTFGGPGDSGVSSIEGLALLNPADKADPKFAHLFELEQPVGTSGLARRLDAKQFFVAMRWDYSVHSKTWLRAHKVKITAKGITIEAQPADWGPNSRTGRIADVSPGVAQKLKLKTDDVVTITIPD